MLYVILIEDDNTQQKTHFVFCEIASTQEQARKCLNEKIGEWLMYYDNLLPVVRHEDFCTLRDNNKQHTVDLYIVPKTILN